MEKSGKAIVLDESSSFHSATSDEEDDKVDVLGVPVIALPRKASFVQMKSKFALPISKFKRSSKNMKPNHSSKLETNFYSPNMKKFSRKLSLNFFEFKPQQKPREKHFQRLLIRRIQSSTILISKTQLFIRFPPKARPTSTVQIVQSLIKKPKVSKKKTQ
jgi:hypothetical protein